VKSEARALLCLDSAFRGVEQEAVTEEVGHASARVTKLSQRPKQAALKIVIGVGVEGSTLRWWRNTYEEHFERLWGEISREKI
jgi:hypothetical protein